MNHKMTFLDKSILVIGGAGFVGSNLCHSLLQSDIKHLTVVDNLLSSEIENLPKDDRLHFIQGSIADDHTLLKMGTQFDYVFHLATFHGNQSSIHNPLADHENNTLTTLKLCEHFKHETRVQKFVYASAGCTVAKKTYDDVTATDEDADISLYHDSPYQISKIIGEFYGNYYWMKYNLPFIKARFQNVYGPREILGAGQWRGTPATIWRNVTPTFIWKALHKQALPLENEGRASRDFIFVDDLVSGLEACALKGSPGEVYNLASGEETSIKNLASIINELTGNTSPVELKKARLWDRSGKRFGSTDKSWNDLKFKAKTSLADGIHLTIQWTQEHRELIKSCMLKHEKHLEESYETS